MQPSLFETDEKPDKISISEAAELASVSIATIRNWIKTGYLQKTGKNYINRASFLVFMQQIAGKEKLISRANKLHKNTFSNINLQNILYQKIHQDISITYENALPESHKNKEGIYYTPEWIISDMLSKVKLTSDQTFLDPCCGTGNFIIQAIKSGISPENVYGYDTDPIAVEITKKRIYEETGYLSKNIIHADFLKTAHQLFQKNIQFDFIFTNPPWGKKIKKELKEKYAKLYGCGKSTDTTSIFMAASLPLVKPNQYLGFLIQEAFFNISTFEDIRNKILERKITHLIDYNKPFKNIFTKAHAIIVQNTSCSNHHVIECQYNNKFFQKQQQSLKENPKKIFNFWTDETESNIIRYLYSIPHITLKNRAIWGMGIVTGNNKKYCFPYPQKDYLPIFKGSDIAKNSIKSPSLYIKPDFSKFQQVPDLNLYNAPEKIIYRFISPNLCFFYDNQQRLILNSANFFIPKNIPISAQQLTDILNSEIINWLFKKLFNTHKILRSDIEELPIHIDYFKHFDRFDENNFLNYLNIIKEQDGTYNINQQSEKQKIKTKFAANNYFIKI